MVINGMVQGWAIPSKLKATQKQQKFYQNYLKVLGNN